jgi:hypothetical protein
VTARRLALALSIGLVPLAAASAAEGEAGARAPVPRSGASTDVLSPGGYTGGALTPSARTMPYGTLGLRYDPQLVGVAPRTEGHNYVLGVGLLPYVEAVGRLAAHDLHCNLYVPGACDDRGWLRDLSMSFKVAVPLDAAQRFSIAAGATDVGGAATNFRSYYGVLGWRQGAFDASIGYGRGDARYAVIDGVFGRLAVRVLPTLELAAERVPDATLLSARAFLPAGWMPDRWQAYADANRRLGDSPVTAPSWLGVGVAIPLDFRGHGPSIDAQRRAAEVAPRPLLDPWGQDPRTPRDAPASGRHGAGSPAPGAPGPAASVASAPAVGAVGAVGAGGSVATAPTAIATAATAATATGTATPSSVRGPSAIDRVASGASSSTVPGGAPTAAAAVTPRVSPASLARIHRVLADAGVEDVAVGEQDRADGGTVVVVRADNGAWRWSDLDAMGVVLGRVVRVLPDDNPRIRVVIGRRGVPTLSVEGTARCIEAALRTDGAECPADARPSVSASGEAAFDGALRDVRWAHRGGNPSWGRVRVGIAPGLRTAVATEYGVWDYSLAAEVNVEVPLWRGASIDARRTFPIANSGDFDDGRVYAPDRHRTVTDRVLLHQTLPIANGLSARAAVGRVFDDWRGGLGEVRWQPGDGTHRLGATIGRFVNGGSLRDGFTSEPALASYRYLVAPLDWAIELTAGRFFLNDTGWSVASRHWFGDVAVTASLRSTTHPNAPQAEHFAGLQIEFPLTPRRSPSMRWLQLQGADRWSYGIETVVGGEFNRLTGGHGIVPPVTNGLDAVHDADRSVGAFASRGWARIREAAGLDAAR